jgi:hypothetical protein
LPITPRSESRSGESTEADQAFDRLIALAGLSAETRRRNDMAETTTSASQQEEEEMKANGRVVVNLATGLEDPERVTVAFLVAGAAGLTAIAIAASRLRAALPARAPEAAVEAAVEAQRAA